MVRSIFKFLHREVGGVHEAAYLLGFFTILSQLLALLRDRLLAHSFGASHTLDLYYAAFRIPDFLFATVASLVSISVLIPLLIEKTEKSPEEGGRFISSIFSIFFVFMILVELVAFILTPWILHLLFPEFAASEMPQLVTLSRILLLSPLFLGLSNLFASITQLYNRFFIYAVSPLLYNLGIIFGLMFLYPRYGLSGLGIGVAAGAFAHFFIQVPFIMEKKLFPRFTVRINFNEIKRIIFISLPRTITVSANEVAELLLVVFAGLVSTGAISVFNFSWNLQSVPLSIIGVSYSLAVFPTLTRLISAGNKKEYLEKMILSAKHIIFLSLPVMTIFIVVRAQIVRVILGSGKFDWTDTRLTAAALALFVFSLIPQSLSLLFVRAQYSAGKTARPLLVNVLSATIIIISGYSFLKYFMHQGAFASLIESFLRVKGLPGTAVLALPLAYTVGISINMIIHWIIFAREHKGFTRPVIQTAFQGIFAAAFIGIVAHISLIASDRFFDIQTVLGVFLHGFVAGILGLAAGIIVLTFLKSQELEEALKTLKKKIWKTKIIAQDPGTVSGGGTL